MSKQALNCIGELKKRYNYLLYIYVDAYIIITVLPLHLLFPGRYLHNNQLKEFQDVHFLGITQLRHL